MKKPKEKTEAPKPKPSACSRSHFHRVGVYCKFCGKTST